MSAETFHISDILTVTTGKFVSTSGMDGLYRILNHVTGDDLMTHQLPRASDEAAPWLRQQFPDLAAVETPDWSDVPRDEMQDAVFGWVAEMVAEHGETRQVEPMPAQDHTYINPLAELAMMRPDMPVIAVAVEDQA